jgi:ankyrin repeat protein
VDDSIVPLLSAANMGYVDVIRVLLTADRPVKIDTENISMETALFLAVQKNHPMAVKLILSHSANTYINFDDNTILIHAVDKGFLEVVKELLLARSPALLNARTWDGKTALYVAMRREFFPIANALLAAGANPNIAEDNGMTPLMWASDIETARHLLDCDADVNARTPLGETALMMLISSQQNDVSLVALLQDRWADASASREDGTNALVLAVDNDRVDAIKLLLATDPPVDVDERSSLGQTALFYASNALSVSRARQVACRCCP